MPYQCAKAVCATFCHHIAGALVPIFGPDFPSQCIPPYAPDHGRMIIDPTIIAQSTRDADRLRRLYADVVTSAGSASPRRERKAFRSTYDESRHHPRHRIRKSFMGRNSPYGTDTDGESSSVIDLNMQDRSQYAPIPAVAPHRVHNTWMSANMPSRHHDAPVPSPWLSVVPRLISTPLYLSDYSLQSRTRSHHNPHLHPQVYPHHHHHYHHVPQHKHAQSAIGQHHWRKSKRSAEHIDADYDYDGGESRTATDPSTAATSPQNAKPSELSLGPDKNAALLLMNLSVRDTSKPKIAGRESGRIVSETTSPVEVAFPRVKRSRANSL